MEISRKVNTLVIVTINFTLDIPISTLLQTIFLVITIFTIVTITETRIRMIIFKNIKKEKEMISTKKGITTKVEMKLNIIIELIPITIIIMKEISILV